MGLTADTIAVEIVGRIDRLEASMRTAEARVGQAAAKMNGEMDKAAKVSETSWIKAARRIAMGFGAITLAASAIRIGQVGVAQYQAITARMRGDWEAAARHSKEVVEGLKSLPFGLGAYAGAVEGITAQIIGLTAALEKLNKVRAKNAANESALNDVRNVILRRRLEEEQSPSGDLNIQRDFDREDVGRKADAMRANGVNEAMVRSFIEESLRYIEARFANQMKDLEKSRNGGSKMFTDFQTAIGNVRFLQGGGGAARPASEGTAKETASNTKATVGKLQELINKIQSGGILFG